MNNTLYLTAAEQKIYDNLSDKLKEGWTMEQETAANAHFESDEVLRMRREMSTLSDHPALKAFIEEFQNNPSKTPQLPVLSDEIMGEFFFVIGASGMTPFIGSLLSTAANDDDIKGIASLSEMRHQLLLINASTSSK